MVAAMVMAVAPLGNAAERITHGTSDAWITEDMLNNTPPSGYQINPATQADAREGTYNAFFLKEQLQEVHIEIEENNLNYLLQNAVDEPYVMTTSVTIGNTKLGYCGLRTKGNYTLYHSYHDNPGSDRFSFTVNFGKYVNKATYGEKQNFFGCDKISFNNFFFDKSMMKEYLSLKLMDEMGLPTPQYGLAKLYINEQYYGVYFMVEAMDTSILEQYWNVDKNALSSYLCKPVGTNFDYNKLKDDLSPMYESDEETRVEVEDMLPTALEWSRKLTALSKGTDFDGKKISVNSQEYLDLLSQVMDVDEVVRYFAVTSWLCQMDNMFTNYQNFALYLSPEGVATLLPWDYDLAFGCYYPSTAETTANYPMDVMYRLDPWQWDSEDEFSAHTYQNFPLFQVIYQNRELMKRYHGYMLECSQIAALGGVIASTGESYDPGYFHSCIAALEESLIAAATEKTADNVYYMNNIRQPADVKAALPNLSRVIAMRSVGVYAQVMGMDTPVSGAGCDLGTLGNALMGDFQNGGELITVDAATSIFVQAEYRGGNRVAAPTLKVTRNAAAEEAVSAQLQIGDKDAVVAYDLKSTAVAKSAFTVTIPLTQQLSSGTCKLYSYANGELTELEVTENGHLRTFSLAKLGTVVLVARDVQLQNQSQNQSGNFLHWLVIGGLAAAGAAVVVIAVISESRRRAKRRN